MKHDKSLDQFFTSSETAALCVVSLKKCLPEFLPQEIIEPSAGAGALMDALAPHYPTAIMKGYDLDPKRADIQKQDFFKFRSDTTKSATLIFGNPPFGKRSKLAIDFFNHATEFADTIAFIVPVQFRKWSVQSKLDKRFGLIHDELLPDDSFVFDNKPYDVRCCFQVWKFGVNSSQRLTAPPPTKHKDFKMWQYNNTPAALNVFKNAFDFAVPRQGYADYGRRETHVDVCEKTTQWILFKGKNKDVRDRLRNLDFETISKLNTSTPGFGKADVVKVYSELYDE